jgi:hypothetical protein
MASVFAGRTSRAVLFVGFAALVPVACISGENGPLGGGGGKGGFTPTDGEAGIAGATGDPCTVATECFGATCLTTEFVNDLGLAPGSEVPGGYCSKLACTKGGGEEECGPGGFCFDLGQYGIPTGVCGRVCETDADCGRTGYFCTDGDSPTYEPLPRKVCLPPDLICALDIPIAQCPEAGAPDSGGSDSAGDAASDASND